MCVICRRSIEQEQSAKYRVCVETLRESEKALVQACEYYLSANGSKPDISWIKAVIGARAALAGLEG